MYWARTGLAICRIVPRIGALLESCLTNGEPFELESVMLTTSGERLMIRTIGEAERRSDGTIVGARGAILDVTAAAAARERWPGP